MSKNLTGAKYNHRVTLRLNDSQYEFLIKVAGILGVTPSDYIRMVINAGLVTSEGDIEKMLQNTFGKKEEVGTDENVKANIDD